ncbi:MAG TPA: AraC family transcriptional regulator ligand-binding domain-containing protein, partial [Mycobacterium sp.]
MVDDPTLTAAGIPTAVLSGVLDIADQNGIVTDRWFSGTGLTAAQFGDPTTKISFRQGATILRRALRALPQRPIGLQVGRRDVLLSFGILGFAMRACETAAEAFALGLELH